MYVLVGCEFSAVVRDAFRALGHDAYSCDILPCAKGPAYHLQTDIRNVIYDGWDLFICHLPCTYFCNSSVRWFTTVPKRPKPGILYGPERWAALDDAAALWRDIWDAPIPKIAMENPIPHRYAVERIGRRYDQIVHPYWFGHGEIKSTCLWLKNLPPLIPTNMVPGRQPRVHHESPGPDRWKRRSITLTGLAEAMASQWG